jgi:hypothetical protein
MSAWKISKSRLELGIAHEFLQPVDVVDRFLQETCRLLQLAKPESLCTGRGD